MGVVSTIAGFLGFGMGISLGLLVGYYLFIYFQSTDVKWGENGFARVSCELIDGISRPYASSIVEQVPRKPRSELLMVKHDGECKATCGPNYQSAEVLEDLTLAGIEDKIATWSFLPKENRQDIQVVKYECGRNYDQKEVAAVLLYLFDIVKGGETGFCKAKESSRRKSSKSNDDLSECAKKYCCSYTTERGCTLPFSSLPPKCNSGSIQCPHTLPCD